MATCPVGHDSSTDDYCSVCGTPMSDPAPSVPTPERAPAPAAPPAEPSVQVCPVCQSVASIDAFFCESCGYDFLTGSLPRSVQQAAADEAPADPVVEVPAEDPPAESVVEVLAEGEPRNDDPSRLAALAPQGSSGEEAPADTPAEVAAEGEPRNHETDEAPAGAEEAPAPALPPVTTFDLDEIAHPSNTENPLVVEASERPAPAASAPAAKPVSTFEALSLGDPGRDLPNPDELRPIAVPPRPQPGPQPLTPPTRPPSAPQGYPPPVVSGPRPSMPPQQQYRPVPQPQPMPAPPQPPTPQQAPAAPPMPAPAPVPMLPTETGPARWVAEVWIDPEWYRAQQAPEQLPSPGQPIIRALRKSTIVIGRSSASGRPDLECGSDTGASRRQAALTTDGIRWFIEDLGSSNGTYVGQVDMPLPTQPITGRVELGPHDRIYVGSWTRIVVRPALRQEADF